MATFEHCLHCKPPVRYPGCQDHCPHYLADSAKAKAERAAAQQREKEKDDYRTARTFKAKRWRSLFRTMK